MGGQGRKRNEGRTSAHCDFLNPFLFCAARVWFLQCSLSFLYRVPALAPSLRPTQQGSIAVSLSVALPLKHFAFIGFCFDSKRASIALDFLQTFGVSFGIASVSWVNRAERAIVGSCGIASVSCVNDGFCFER
jgi:hypothetical protein